MWKTLTPQQALNPLSRLLAILNAAINPIEDEEDHSDLDLYAMDEDDDAAEDDDDYGYERDEDDEEADEDDDI